MAVVRSQGSLPTPRCCYDVFLSFRGEDIRKTFIDHLYTALVQVGFHTFRDDDEIRRGENIESELQKAIEQSRISIIVFSKTYADSRWCLDELLKILHVQNTSRQQVLPVFYDVDPSDVRKQKRSFAEAFARHEMQCEAEIGERKNELMKKVESWRRALGEVADLAGMVLQNQSDGHEAKFIQKIVNVIKEKLDRGILRITPFLIGVNHRVKDVNLWLKDERMDASIFVICGMGGVGKTTIAKVVYNLDKGNFDGSSFLASINQRSKTPGGLVEVQKQLLSDIGKEQTVRFVDDGIIKIKEAICCKRLLLVLDDVDEVDQLDSVFGMREWFSTGSKVIITTRRRCLFKAHEVYGMHEVEHLNTEESLQLLSLHAFGQHHPSEDYMEMSERVVQHCGGLPLALKVMGSSLAGKTLSVWKSALEKLKEIPNHQILRKLEISYYSLIDDHDKELFLHIACFFVGWEKDWITKILDECNFYTSIGIQNLVDRCLLTIDTCDRLTMHQLIRDLGREIVRQESPKQLGIRSRLWRHKDSLHVLSEKQGSNTIEGLLLDMRELEEDKLGVAGLIVNNAKKSGYEEIRHQSFVADLGHSFKRSFLSRFTWHPVGTSFRNSSNVMSLDTNAFVKMDNLKFLQLNYIEIKGCLKKFPKSLRWLCLDGFQSEFLPSDFPLENLVALQMRHSGLKQIWKESKFLNRLKILDLSHSHKLTKTPDFSGLTKLEILILEDCSSLVEVHTSIAKLEGLILLNLKDSKNLKKFPRNICMLKSIETLIISGCSNLDWLPNELGTMSSLKVLHADGVDIKQVFSTTDEVQPWSAIIWSGLLKPQKSSGIPAISLPCSLVELSLAGCSLSDDAFPLALCDLSLVEKLDLSKNPICSLPESINFFTRLEHLQVNSCRSLTSISHGRDGRDLSLYQHILTLFCYDCCNIIEIEGYFKLEPLKDVDIQLLRRWGFSNINTDVMVHYLSALDDLATRGRKLPLQRLFQQGVYNYFLHRNTIPEEFSIRSTGSPVSFVVPSLVNYKIRGLVVCSLYTSCGSVPYGGDTLFIRWKKRSKIAYYGPLCYGVPNTNENMVWVSHWKVGDRLQGGEEMDLCVGTVSIPGIRCIDVKEVGIQLVYELQEENETPSMLDSAVSQSCVAEYPFQLLVDGSFPFSRHFFQQV